MFVRPFRYERAESLHDACAMLRAHGDGAKAIAGGQSLLPMVNLGLVEPEVLVDLSRANGPRGVAQDDGHLRIGALMRHRELERDGLVNEHQPLLAEAVRHVGSPRIRVRGTLGGSLAHSDPAAELPLAMTLLGAEYEVTDGESQRTVLAGEFHLSYFTTALAEDELLLEVRVPKLGPGWGWGFVEVSRRPGDFALVAAGALVRVARAEIVEARVAIGGVCRAARPGRGGRDGGRGRRARETWTGGSHPSRGSNRSRTRGPRRSTAGIWRGSWWSERWRTPWRARKRRRELRGHDHAVGERSANDAQRRRPPQPASVAPRRPGRDRPEVRVRRGHLRLVHGPRGRGARLELHRARGAGRGRRDHDGRGTRRSGRRARLRCRRPSTGITPRNADSARRA